VTRRRRAPRPDPRILYLVYLGIALGTVLVPQTLRHAILWLVLALLALIYVAMNKIQWQMDLASISRGVLLGAGISLPIYVFGAELLRAPVQVLYGTENPIMLFYLICFVVAPFEEVLFRGALLQGTGLALSLGLYALAGLVLFVPHVALLVALGMVLAMAILGLLYAYVADAYGLAAAIACHVVVGFVLQVLPTLSHRFSLLII